MAIVPEVGAINAEITTQAYGAVVEVYVPRQRRRRRLAQAQVLFHPLDGDLFSFGIEHRSAEGADVAVSDPERTLLDRVDRPRSLVGSRRAHEIVASAVGRVDVDRRAAHAARWPKSSTRQRLGVPLERAGTAQARLAPLAASLGPGRTVAPLHAGDPVRGPIDPTWLVATGGEA